MTTATPTLTDFLLARIAEDEALARAAQADQPRWDEPDWAASVHAEASDWFPATNFTAAMSPERVLAECKAKRRIVESLGASIMHRPVMRLVAAVYADHPDYREEWRP